jgi:putative heme-binding domain-containing protein
LESIPRSREPELTRHAIIVGERFRGSSSIRSLLYQQARQGESFVRFQVALSAGTMADDSVAQSALVQLAEVKGGDPWIRTAVLTAPPDVADQIAKHLLAPGQLQNYELLGRCEIVRQLGIVIGARPEGKDAAIKMLSALTPDEPPIPNELVNATLAGIGEGLARRQTKLSSVIDAVPNSQRLERHLAAALETAADGDQSVGRRITAMQLLPFLNWPQVRPALLAAIEATEPRDVQRAALAVLAKFSEPKISHELLARWKQFSPPLRDEAVGILLSRPIWHEALVAAIEKGEIPAGQVSIPHRQRLAALSDPKLAERAKGALAAVALGPRKEILEKYQPVLSLKGDGERGKIVYRRECQNCHKLAGEGHDVGPSLETVQHRSPQEILIHVLDPSREVSPQFLDYAVRLTDGRVVTGLIAGETDAGLTLRRAEKQEESILRSEIAEITSSGKSLMPDGMEQKIKLEEMADLIAYLRQARG